jgi:hypothetical protein
VVVVRFTLLYWPQGDDPVLQGVPASASNVNVPLRVEPSLKVTPVKVRVKGTAEATSDIAPSAIANRIKRIRLSSEKTPDDFKW